MLEKLEIRNFQSHENTTLALAPITVLKGSSDSGKSAAIRALLMMVEYTWENKNFRQGFNQCTIALTMDGGKRVQFNRTGDSFDFTYDGKLFAKQGKNIPVEILNLISIKPIKFDEDLSLNPCIQRQMDPMFLLSESGPAIARFFGEISGLEVLFRAQKTGEEELREIQETIRNLNSQAPGLDASIRANSYAEEHMERVKSCDAKVSAINVNIDRADSLRNWASKVQERSKAVTAAPTPPGVDGEKLGDAERKLFKANILVSSALNLKERIKRVESLKLPPKPPAADTDGITTNLAAANNLRSAFARFEKASAQLATAAVAYGNARTAKEEVSKAALEEAMENGLCPMCGQKADSKVVGEHLRAH